jgi:hypothetical protein
MNEPIVEMLEAELARTQDAAKNLAQQVAHLARLLDLARQASKQPTLPALEDAAAPK